MDVEDPVHDTELVVEETGPDEDRQQPGHRIRDHEHRPVEAAHAHPLLVQGDREEQAESEGQQDRQRREHDRPEKDAQERLANERVVDQPVEVREADPGPPSGLDLLTARRCERAFAVVAKDDAVLDPRERVGTRVVAKRLLEGDGRIEPLRPDRARLPGRHGVVRQCLVQLEQLVSLDERVAGRARDGAVGIDLDASCRQGLQPLGTPYERLVGVLIDENEDQLPARVVGGRHRVRRPARCLGQRVLFDRLNGVVLRSHVTRRVLVERDVDRVHDRSNLERQEEDRPGHQKLCRNGPPRQIDRVDRGGRRSEHRERDPVVLSDEDRRGPHRDPVHHREKRDLHREADRAREDLDGAHRQRTSHRCGAGDP